ncbi:hypothetical protein CXB51_031448 [Gossypium anomalum]|uniref:RING-type E3 ubiquitin transferase n=1 Tax=Gossypium anomalum TaxID=47600 RepID=A0A8J6CP14_9ROSI|nr:hypothetical protein CXB51_031448 [Gossypium anomalum]
MFNLGIMQNQGQGSSSNSTPGNSGFNGGLGTRQHPTFRPSAENIEMNPNNGHIAVGPTGPGQVTGSGPLQRNIDLNVEDDEENLAQFLSLDLLRTLNASGDDQIPTSGGGSSSPVMIHSGSAGYVVEENISRVGLPTDAQRRLLCKRTPEVPPPENNVIINTLNGANSVHTGTHSAAPVAAPPTVQVGQIDNFQRNTRFRPTVNQQNPGQVNLWQWNSNYSNLQQPTGHQRPAFSSYGHFSSPQLPVMVNQAMLQQVGAPNTNPLQAPHQPSQYWNGATMSPFAPSPVMIPPANMQLQANMNLLNGNAGFPGNIGASSRTQAGSAMHTPFSSIGYPQLNRQQHLADRSEAWRMANYGPIHYDHYGAPSTVRDMDALMRGGNPRPAQFPQRLGAIAERQAGHHSRVSLSPIPLSQFAAQRRRRLLYQLRNYLRLLRRAGNLRLEDAMLLGRSYLNSMRDLDENNDEMRVDVDNMSYEELLDLEEQIGDVSTGLSEETIMANLRRRKYQPITVQPPAEAEPCCICQEDYVNGEELGKLDCGHDFHFNCIKQWLVQKNSCPVCKKTALAI